MLQINEKDLEKFKCERSAEISEFNPMLSYLFSFFFVSLLKRKIILYEFKGFAVFFLKLKEILILDTVITKGFEKVTTAATGSSWAYFSLNTDKLLSWGRLFCVWLIFTFSQLIFLFKRWGSFALKMSLLHPANL